VSDYALLFACAQKNAGIAGVTVAVVNRELLREVAPQTPSYLILKNQIESGSLFNTPPTFAIYVLKLMLQWIRDTYGDLAEVERQAGEKARVLYDVIDAHPDCFRGHAAASARSHSNVTFFLPSDKAQQKFLEGAQQRGMTELRGHRSVGGVRASIYNAMPLGAVRQLSDYMQEFAASR
jgi:phosphoserine aminotransferase